MPLHADGFAVVSAGPPENVRDHVMAASKSLGSGDWTNAYAHLAALPVWALVPGREQVLPHPKPITIPYPCLAACPPQLSHEGSSPRCSVWFQLAVQLVVQCSL